jgi:hypothetical protein
VTELKVVVDPELCLDPVRAMIDELADHALVSALEPEEALGGVRRVHGFSA